MVRICRFVAPIDFKRSNLFSSVDKKPFNILSMATIRPIKMVIKIMALLPVPNQIIIKGPSAIFGRAFNTTKYGSEIRLNSSLHQSNNATA